MEGFVFAHPHHVTIADINYGGHVSNAAVLNYFQDARSAYLAAVGRYSEMDIGGSCGIILAEARVRYRAERDGQVTAEGETTLVAFDYQQRRPRRVPQGFRDAVGRFDGHGRGEQA